MNTTEVNALYRRLFDTVTTHIQGQDATVRKLLAAFVAGGHVLLEDLPGTGKTTLAKVLAAAVDCQFQRIQFTPDLLPSDIIGVSIYDQREQAFRVHQGPVFSEILLADEINRASPRAQSALLEAMEEKQVSLDGIRHPLSELFFVIATQNPVEFHGTYPLPEAQMDRFALRTSLGYVSAEEEVRILSARHAGDAHRQLPPVCLARVELLALKQHVTAIRVSEEIKHYIVALIRATRTAPGVLMGASLRAGFALLRLAQALALFDGEAFVSPEHVQELAVAVVAHRLKLDSQAHFAGRREQDVVRELLQNLPVPV